MARLTIILMLAAICSVNAAGLYSQNALLTINMNRKTVKEVFNAIEKQSEFIIFYSDNVVDVDRVVSVKAKNVVVNSILDDLFRGTDNTYEIDDRQIMITSVERPVSGPAPATVKQSPTRRITGRIVDDRGEALAGVYVVVRGTATGTTTNFDGTYVLDIPAGSVLTYSFLGFMSRDITPAGDIQDVVMHADERALEEVVVVGFGQQKKESVIGAIQSFKSSDMKMPTANLSNSFAGRISGVIAVQQSGEPGADGSNFWIRGVSTFADAAQNPLILIDGVESSSYDLNALAPEVIENFSVLKDATATALYGSRGANGVMIITTKTGHSGKARINLRVEGRVSTPTQIPELTDGVQYMNMFNEAIQARATVDNPNPSPMFTPEQIKGTVDRLDPLVFPNVNWYETLFKNVTFTENVNLNVSGGMSDRVTYFMSASVANESGLLKTAKENPFNNNIHNLRYSFQANVNSHLTKTTKVGVKLNVQVQDLTGPLNTVNYLFERVMWASPSHFPVKFPQTGDMNYIPFGNKSGGPQLNRYPNPYAELSAGVNSIYKTTTMGTFDLEQNLDFITKGLSLTGQFSMKVFNNTATGKYMNPFYYEIDPTTLEEAGGKYTYELRQINATDANASTTAVTARNSNTSDRLMNMNAMLNYQRTFGRNDVNAQLVYLQRGYYRNNPGSTDYNAALPERNQGLAGRVTYNYDSRYFLELNFAYNGSDNFQGKNQFGFFPSIALGYIISNEKFFEPLKPVVSLLKLRGSYGLVGNSLTSQRFQGYTNLAMNGPSYIFGPNFVGANSRAGANIVQYGNPNATWERSVKKNLGLELGFFKDRLLIIADFFREDRDRILLRRATVPASVGMGTAAPWANVGKTKNQGVDLSVEYNHVFSPDFLLQFKGSFTYARNTVVFRDEPDYEWAYQYERGGPMNRIGPAYISLGLFKDQEDIENSPVQTGNVMPGDIKYKDMNGDNVIDDYDKTYIGKPTIPEIVYGFGVSAKYKRWDFSVYFQGISNVSIYVNNVGDKGVSPFGTYHKNVLKFIADDYWSEKNPNPNATYPRLSHTTGRDNTNQLSTHWLRNGAFLRLKNLEVGYTMKHVRIYVSGSNLLTFSPFKYWDPELGGYDGKPENESGNLGTGLRYPLQRIVNLGVQLNF